MYKQSGFITPFIIVTTLIVFVTVIGFGTYYLQNRTTESGQTEILEPSTTESSNESTPQAIESNVLEAPEIEEPTPSPTLTPSAEPSATPLPVQIKETTEKDKCILLFETSYNLDGTAEDCS
jgi:hypothetical protein